MCKTRYVSITGYIDNKGIHYFNDEGKEEQQMVKKKTTRKTKSVAQGTKKAKRKIVAKRSSK